MKSKESEVHIFSSYALLNSLPHFKNDKLLNFLNNDIRIQQNKLKEDKQENNKSSQIISTSNITFRGKLSNYQTKLCYENYLQINLINIYIKMNFNLYFLNWLTAKSFQWFLINNC